MKQKWVLLSAVIAGILAFWLTGRYLNSERDRIMAGAKKIPVVVAAKTLMANTILKQSDLARDMIFKENAGGREISPDDFPEILNKKLLQTLKEGDAILWSDLDVPYVGAAGLAAMLNAGLRALAVPVDTVSSVGGLIKPNDHVDILGTFNLPSKTATGQLESVTLTLLQDVTVLATDQTLARKSESGRDRAERSRGYSTMTLEVTPSEAELLVFAQTVKGRLTFTLRNPNDVSYLTNIPSINFEYLHQKIPDVNVIRQRDIRHKKDVR